MTYTLSLTDIQPIDKKGLRFALQAFDEAGVAQVRIPGWRLVGGQIRPPMRRSEKGAWYASVEILDKKFEERLLGALKKLKDVYPEVEFPSEVEVEVEG